MLLAECTILLLPLDVVRVSAHGARARSPHARLLSLPPLPPLPPQGNRAGLVGCGFWNSGCGGLDLTFVWQIMYGCIAGLVCVVFPFFIFFYEADDEGMQAAEDNPESCIARCCDFRNCKRSCLSATCYTAITVVLSAIIWLVSYNYLSTTYLPYKLAAVDTSTVAWASVDTPIHAIGGVTLGKCKDDVGFAGVDCVLPCGTGVCTVVSVWLALLARRRGTENVGRAREQGPSTSRASSGQLISHHTHITCAFASDAADCLSCVVTTALPLTNVLAE